MAALFLKLHLKKIIALLWDLLAFCFSKILLLFMVVTLFCPAPTWSNSRNWLEGTYSGSCWSYLRIQSRPEKALVQGRWRRFRRTQRPHVAKREGRFCKPGRFRRVCRRNSRKWSPMWSTRRTASNPFRRLPPWPGKSHFFFLCFDTIWHPF